MKKLSIVFVLVLTIAIVISIVVFGHKDNGFIEPPECEQGTGLHWKHSALPLPIFISGTTSEKWIASINESRERWNSTIEKYLFSKPTVVAQSMACSETGENYEPKVLLYGIDSDGISVNAHTRLFWNSRCEILCAEVYLPELMDLELWEIIGTHELGHVLGLQHDEIKDSVMFPGGEAVWTAMKSITESDRELLKETYR
jgi:hypothetical protein